MKSDGLYPVFHQKTTILSFYGFGMVLFDFSNVYKLCIYGLYAKILQFIRDLEQSIVLISLAIANH